MDEVDKIIIFSLREIGCDIEDDVESLKQFTSELVVEAAARCIEAIQPGSGIPTSLPPSMSQRFRIGATMAQACTDLGYTGEVGYQTFLYSNEADLRKVLMFLIERLPKESEKNVHEPSGKSARLQKEISATVAKQLAAPWVPSFCRSEGLRWYEDGTFVKEGATSVCGYNSSPLQTGNSLASCTPQEWREYCVRYLPLMTDQVAAASRLIPSLITLNSRGILAPSQHLSPKQKDECRLKMSELLVQELDRCSVAEEGQSVPIPGRKISSRFALNQKLQFAPELSPERRKPIAMEPMTADKSAEATAERQRLQEEAEHIEMEKVKEENEQIREHIEQLQRDVKTLSAKLPKVMELSSAAERSLKEAENQETVRRRILELLPDADGNVNKLQAMIEASTQKLVNLAAQWEKHRTPLMEQYRQARQLHSSKASESARQAEALRVTREKVAEVTEELRIKEELQAQLQAEYAKVNKDISRSAYTQRILEIINNVFKQKQEIEKVLQDTKVLQKEINTLSGRLDRSFTLADETIFRDAKKDDVSRRAYKLLAALHSECGELVNMVTETGASVRESRDLEDQIETESAKNVSANLERISADLRQMKQETAALTAQLKSKS